MEFGLRLIGWELYSTQKFSLTAEYAEVCPKRFGATVQRAVGFAKLGGQSVVGDNWAGPNGMGPGAGCEAPTVQWAAPTMVGWSFGRNLSGRTCTVRKSLSQTIWVCAVGCAQWVDPTDQLAQFGTKRAKRGAGGLGAFGPNSGRPQFLLS